MSNIYYPSIFLFQNSEYHHTYKFFYNNNLPVDLISKNSIYSHPYLRFYLTCFRFFLI